MTVLRSNHNSSHSRVRNCVGKQQMSNMPADWLEVRWFLELFTRHFFDVSVCNPLASSYMNLSTDAMMRKNIRGKQREYEQRVSEVKHGSFTPLVFAVTGGMGLSASIFYKHLASLIVQEKDRPYCQVTSWIRSLLRFSFWEQPSWQSARGSRSACRFSDADSDRIVCPWPRAMWVLSNLAMHAYN